MTVGRHTAKRRLGVAGLTVVCALGTVLFVSIPILYLQAQPPPVPAAPTVTPPPIPTIYEVTGAGEARIAVVDHTGQVVDQGWRKLPIAITVAVPDGTQPWITAAVKSPRILVGCVIRANGEAVFADVQLGSVTCPS